MCRILEEDRRLVIAFAWAEHHDVRMGARIDYVLIASSVVGGVVDPHRFVSVDTPVDNADVIALFWGVRVLAALRFVFEYSREEVFVEMRYEMLGGYVRIPDERALLLLTRSAGSSSLCATTLM